VYERVPFGPLGACGALASIGDGTTSNRRSRHFLLYGFLHRGSDTIVRLSLSDAAGVMCRADPAVEWSRGDLAAVFCEASCCLIGADEMPSIAILPQE
jgi:hypothetical protein